MAKKLYLYLDYKGKPLDYVRQGKDFTNRFFIGSSKYEYFQILDPSFPEHHLFLTHSGNRMNMHLTPGVKLQCQKDGNPVDNSYLTSNNILRGDVLELHPDMTGTIALAPDWEIKYLFKEPWVTVLTPEEKQIIAQYARFSEPTSLVRFNRNLVLLFVFLTFVFILIFDLVIKPRIDYESDATLQEKLKTLQKAEQIKFAEAQKLQGSTFEQQEGTTGEEPKETAPTGQTTTAGTGTGTTKSAGSMFGIGEFDPNATSSGTPIRVVTTSEGFVAARPGHGGGGGGGSGDGPGGSGYGPGYGSPNFDPNAPRSFGSDIGQVATNAPRVGGSSIRPSEGTFVNVAGDQSKLAPSGVVFGQTGKMTTAIQQFRSKKIQEVKEGTIDESLAPQTKTNYENISSSVNARKSQLYSVYQKWSSTIAFSGSVSISLLIKANGRVETAAITPKDPMPNGFLEEIKRLCESWSFNVNEDSYYTFPARFRKG